VRRPCSWAGSSDGRLQAVAHEDRVDRSAVPDWRYSLPCAYRKEGQMRRLLLSLLLFIYPFFAIAAELQDATGRSVRIPGQPGRIRPAGPPAAAYVVCRGIPSDLRVRTGLRQNATGLAPRRSEISDIENSSSRDSPPNSRRFARDVRYPSLETGLLAANLLKCRRF
jgi:hypothetical protein